ncbi:MAG: hypothetical protein WBA23_08170 [Tunicatimonas sp.]|uniref:hypothetical protein n=1 Tax=Tunicatimonas sp. TaxID=1940096 RepID=UPI003C713BCF
MAKAVPDTNSKNVGKKSSWKKTTTIIWFAVVGIIIGLAAYVWTLRNSEEAQQVRRLKQELDSISNRSYQLQHKIDSLNRLDVAEDIN